MTRTVTGFVAVVLLAGSQISMELPNATVEHGGFAFPDMSGTRLMLLSAIDRRLPLYPETRDILAATVTMKTALCTSGATHPIEFTSHQRADGTGNGRQYAHQFDHLDGFVFRLRDGQQLQENETCFVATDAFARSLTRVGLVQPDDPGACDAGLATRIASLRKRPVAHCWTRARPDGQAGPRVLIVQFVRQGNSALASLVVEDGSRLVFSDMPGDYSREDGHSVWRVDDNGDFDPKYIKVVFLAKRRGALVLATNWIGPEGTVLGLYESAGDRFRQIILDSWYQAPV